MKSLIKSFCVFVVTLFFQAFAFGYANCPDHVSQYIQNRNEPGVRAQIEQICRTNGAMIIICGLDFRDILPSLMRTPQTFLMALDVCKHESHAVLMCTQSTLEKGPYLKAEPSALQDVVKGCFE